MSTDRPLSRRAFTLIELIAVIVVLAILAGIAIPKYFDYSSQAKVSSCKSTLGSVRQAIGNFYGQNAVVNIDAYPTLAQLQAVGTVMQEPLPANPYNNDSTIAAATWSVTPPVSGTSGWNYDAATGRFWANTSPANSW